MEVGGSIPIHAYRATYAPAPTTPPPVPTPPPAAQTQVQDLVAARVATPIDFPSAEVAPATSKPHAFPLYTRAADAVEAAVGVRAGRMIDVRA